MAGLVLIEPTHLYNLLQLATRYPCISDSNYMLLLDARKEHEYAESHVTTARKAPRDDNNELMVPYDAELECKTHVIVYDGHTVSTDEHSPATECAQLLSDMGSMNPVKILTGGYEAFSALYPFLRTQKIIYMPQELDMLVTYPVEVIEGQLYMSTYQQASQTFIHKDLKIKAHVNVSTQADVFYSVGDDALCIIAISDDITENIQQHFTDACHFIDENVKKSRPLLVYSDRGISRCASLVIAYLMHKYSWTLRDAYTHVLECQPNIRPNRGFIKQLSDWEKCLSGETSTDISDPNY